MRLITFNHGAHTRLGVLNGDRITDLSRAAPDLPTEMNALLHAGDGAMQAARAAAGELAAEEGEVERHARRAAVDDDAEGRAMAFAEGRNAETLSEDITHVLVNGGLKKERRRTKRPGGVRWRFRPTGLATEVLGNTGDDLLALFAVAEEAVLNSHLREVFFGHWVFDLGDFNFDFEVTDGPSIDGHFLEFVIHALIGFAHALHGVTLGVDGPLDGVEDHFRRGLVAGD